MASRTRYYIGGYDPAKPQQNRAEEWSTVTGYTAWSLAGAVTAQRALTQAEADAFAAEDAAALAVTNETTLRDRAAAALTANDTFLALASPTNAQTLAQVQKLTRECSGLIRLVIRALDTTDGT